ncbi:hypothetical protein ZEAMMB73_Zm00001d005668 [Zea mays]|uniref:Uncharacterized protein n=1 Tax=Zea mays TaxID=4577 RepID=A0A1D6EPD5_MAIZE|nr:hypothetical protein ZEAMMB73_Zm00001d005668 [Zea mays]
MASGSSRPQIDQVHTVVKSSGAHLRSLGVCQSLTHAIRFNRLRQPLHVVGGGEMKWGLAAIMASTTTVARDFSGDKCRRSEETAGYKDLQLQLPSKSDL